MPNTPGSAVDPPNTEFDASLANGTDPSGARTQSSSAGHVDPSEAAVVDKTNLPPPPAPPIATSYVVVECTRCGAGLRLDPNSAGLTCPGCSAKDYFYACPKCRCPTRVSETLIGKNVKCTKCGDSNQWSKWTSHHLTAQAFACDPAEVALLDDPNRRVVSGKVIAQSGFAPLAEGVQCSLEFCRDQVNIVTRQTNGARERIIQIPYAHVTALEVNGPGATTTTTSNGHGWIRERVVEGGLIAGGLSETLGGFLIETASELVPEKKKTTTTVETDIQFSAGPRGLVLRHENLTPRVLQVRLAPAFARIEAAKTVLPPTPGHPPPPPPPPPPPVPASTSATADDATDHRLSKLKQLAELRSSGVLTEEEFLSEKSRILSGP